MSADYDVSPRGLDDVEAAAVFIATKDLAAAERFVEQVYDVFDLLASNPNLGHRRPDLTSFPVFFWTFLKRYAVVTGRASRSRSCVWSPGGRT